MLEALDFRCSNEGCGIVTSYSNAKNHAIECNKKPIPCTKNCGRFCKQEFMELHHFKECKESIFICEECNATFNIRELDDIGLPKKHDCPILGSNIKSE